MIFAKTEKTDSTDERWALGKIFGLAIPADAETLLSDGPAFLTKAFHTIGTLNTRNRVNRIVHAEDIVAGGTGKKLLLKVEYELPEPDLFNELFIKFSRNFDNELWDRARSMMISEANFAVLSRSSDFPVRVPVCLFADVESASSTGLIITECIRYGQNGLESFYPKCLDYRVPEPLEHYKTILKALASLSAAHRCGKLSPEFDRTFPFNGKQAAAVFSIRTPLEKLLERAQRMFDFINRYPRLFPDNVRDPEFHKQYMNDLPDVIAAQERIRELLYGNPELIAFAHWNANIDNCWFWRNGDGELQCGFLDWANAGQISVAQAINGAISGARPLVWNQHLDELLTVFIDTFADQGGPRLSLKELRLHTQLIVAVSGVAYAMGAPVALEREIENLDALQSDQDHAFLVHENARIQLHMMTKMLNLWQTQALGDVIRSL